MTRRVEKVFDKWDPLVVWVKGGPKQQPKIRLMLESSVGYNMTEEDAILLADRIADCLDEEKPTYKTKKSDRRRLAAYARGERDDD